MASPSEDEEGLKELKEVAKKLFEPLPPVPELLDLLDKAEKVLSEVEQAPADPKLAVVLSMMQAFVIPDLLRHSDLDVRIFVTSCISEVTRISAPNSPYDEEHMKEYFELALVALKKLSLTDGRCYGKAVSILRHIAKIRSSLMMLDLEYDEIIFEMFQLFLNETRAGHPSFVYSDMETIMTLVIQEIEEISLDIVVPLLTSLRKENQKVVPHSYKMGETVFKKCAGILRPHVDGGIRFLGVTEEVFSEIVSSVCQGTFEQELSVTGDTTAPDVSCPAVVVPSLDGPRSITSNGSAEVKSTSHLGDQVLVERGHQVTVDTTLDVCGPAEVGPSLDGLPTTMNDGSDETKNTSHSDSMKPKKRGRKPKSLMAPGGCGHLLSEESGRPEPIKDQSSKSKMCHSQSADASASQDQFQTFSDGNQRQRRHKKKADSMDHASDEEVTRYLKANSRWRSRKSGITSKFIVHDDEITGETAPDVLSPAEVGLSLDGLPQSIKNNVSAETNTSHLGDGLLSGQVLVEQRHQVTGDTAPDVVRPAGVGPSLDGLPRKITIIGPAERKNTSHLGEGQGCQTKATSGGNRTGSDSSDALNPKKRGRKPKSLMRPGASDHLLSEERKTPLLTGCRKKADKKAGGPISLVGKDSGRSEQTKDQSSSPKMSQGESADADQTFSDGTQRKRRQKRKADFLDHANEEEVKRYLKANSRKRSKKTGVTFKFNVHDDEVDEVPIPGKRYGKELIGRPIRVWWPLDKAYYEGGVVSFDPTTKTHMILYADGDSEELDLTKEEWLLVPSPEKSCQQDQEMNVPPSESSCDGQQMKNVKIESVSS